MKKALIYDPYLDTLGGGERYTLTFAQTLVNLGYSVDLAWENQDDLQSAEKRFGFDLSKISLNKAAFRSFKTQSSIVERFLTTSSYDLIFWVSDGSLPLLFGKKNLVHFQVPFTRLGGNSLLNQIKFLFINRFVYNSEFTRNVLERVLPKSKGVVLFPPIDTESFSNHNKKENIILSVARFDSPSHSKRQDVLIDAFKEFCKSNNHFKLILAGGQVGNSSQLEKLRSQALGQKVEFHVNPDFEELKSLYAKAKIFWHAAGYGIDEAKNPEKVEHFGMTTVEAMSAGCVPVVIAKGGQKSIVSTQTGALVLDQKSIIMETLEIVNKPVLLESLSKNAMRGAQRYSVQEFKKQLGSLL